ncbi:MAG: hypothetical protein NTX50_17170 [Candidatus Sumerlaeota bacterium]|nr:hypothetical protein [Candidatus Sumerlaeota bacterium]
MVFLAAALFFAFGNLAVQGQSNDGPWKSLSGSFTSVEEQASFSWTWPERKSSAEAILFRQDGKRCYFHKATDDGRLYEEAFDGAKTCQLSASSSAGPYKAVTGSGSLANPIITDRFVDLMPLRFSYALMGHWLHEYAFGKSARDPEKEVLQGVTQVYTLRYTDETLEEGLRAVEALSVLPQLHRWVLGIDPAKGNAVVLRRQYSSDGRLLFQARGEDYENLGNGAWAPKLIRAFWQGSQDARQPKRKTLDLLVRNEGVRTGVTFAPGDFNIQIPPGASIYDYNLGKSVTGPDEKLGQEQSNAISKMSDRRQRSTRSAEDLHGKPELAQQESPLPLGTGSGTKPSFSAVSPDKGITKRFPVSPLVLAVAGLTLVGAFWAFWPYRRRISRRD